MRFHDYTITPHGALYSARVHETADLEPAAVATFARLLAQGGDVLGPIPYSGTRPITVEWRSFGTAALARFRVAGELATVCALVGGRDPGADARALAALESLARELCERAGLRCGDGLWESRGRPALLALVVPVLRPELLWLADMGTCLAGAFFLGALGEPGKTRAPGPGRAGTS